MGAGKMVRGLASGIELSVVKTPNYVDKETITKITGTGGTLKGLVAAEKLHLEFAETRSSAQMRLCCWWSGPQHYNPFLFLSALVLSATFLVSQQMDEANYFVFTRKE